MRLMQVASILLSNAIKYNRDGGRIYVSIDKGSLNDVTIVVRDSGEGIDPVRQGEVFQPFNRLGLEAGAIEGAGVGLGLAKKIVEEMGGEIGFESELGVGSTFWVKFLVSQATAT